MSAPDTNLKTQMWYHRPPLIGMAAVVVAILAFVFLSQLSPDDDATPPATPIVATE